MVLTLWNQVRLTSLARVILSSGHYSLRLEVVPVRCVRECVCVGCVCGVCVAGVCRYGMCVNKVCV